MGCETRAIAEGVGISLDLQELASDLVVTRTIVLVGLMGAGKTTVGRKIAGALRLPFRDADHEIEHAAGKTVREIFAEHGEAEFRRGERQVIARLLREPPHVLATGGGAFMDATTQEAIAQSAVSVWLRSDLDVLAQRLDRRDATRPLLAGQDIRAVLRRLIEERHPVYAKADIVIDSGPGPLVATARAVLLALRPVFGRSEASE